MELGGKPKAGNTIHKEANSSAIGTQIMVIFEKVPGHNFFKLSLKIYASL